MGAQLDKLKAYHTAVSDQNPTAPIRVRLSDADALALVAEVGFKALTHGAKAEEGSKELGAALAMKQPEGDALITWANNRKAAMDKFWDAISGQVINGVEILRKPS